ncbi:MAG: aspartate--ammonia ligase, partial [Ureaplasma sp.]|nr:aspartate--ammonia ligase [Ureaplasma sp.]
LYTDMNAIRADEDVDFSHSIYVDQWDWEIVISKHNYNIHFLHKIVEKFYKCLLKLEKRVNNTYLNLNKKLPKELHFITSEELYNLYPNVSAKERENIIAKKYKAVFISQIGGIIPNTNEKHDSRAKDYDNWKLNGDLIVYHEPTNTALELMSLGIRVDDKALIEQAEINLNEINNLPAYYQMILNKELPLTIGGGLGQSRLCMFLLEKEHIGEVQVSVWPDKQTKENEFIL